MTDGGAVRNAVVSTAPAVIFHLAAQSFVPASWRHAQTTLATTTLGTLAVLEAGREVDATVVVACSSEEYGLVLPDECRAWGSSRVWRRAGAGIGPRTSGP